MEALGSNGLPVWDRVDFTSRLIERASPAVWDKITDAFPGSQPGFETTDGFLDGQNPQSGQNATGMHWETPTGPLFATGADGSEVSAQDVWQGAYGDCWFVSTVIATAQIRPSFIRDGIRENSNGSVSVRLFDEEGGQHWVTVTPDLPVNGVGELVSARGAGSGKPDATERWPAYYEKAFAVAYQGDRGGAPDTRLDDDAYNRTEQGSYGALEWDFNEQAAPYVTGRQADEIEMDLAEVQRAFEQGRPVVVSSQAVDDVPDELRQTYVPRHVFYVQGFEGDKVVLGNPWGPERPPVIVGQSDFEDYFKDARALDVP